jgi:hypothetical protein
MGFIMKTFNKLKRIAIVFAILGFLGANTLFCFEEAPTIDIELPNSPQFDALEREKAKLLEELFEAEIRQEKIKSEVERLRPLVVRKVNNTQKLFKGKMGQKALISAMTMNQESTLLSEVMTKQCEVTLLIQTLETILKKKYENLNLTDCRKQYKARRNDFGDLDSTGWAICDRKGEVMDFSDEKTRSEDSDIFVLPEHKEEKKTKLPFGEIGKWIEANLFKKKKL